MELDKSLEVFDFKSNEAANTLIEYNGILIAKIADKCELEIFDLNIPNKYLSTLEYIESNARSIHIANLRKALLDKKISMFDLCRKTNWCAYDDVILYKNDVPIFAYEANINMLNLILEIKYPDRPEYSFKLKTNEIIQPYPGLNRLKSDSSDKAIYTLIRLEFSNWLNHLSSGIILDKIKDIEIDRSILITQHKIMNKVGFYRYRSCYSLEIHLDNKYYLIDNVLADSKVMYVIELNPAKQLDKEELSAFTERSYLCDGLPKKLYNVYIVSKSVYNKCLNDPNNAKVKEFIRIKDFGRINKDNNSIHIYRVVITLDKFLKIL